MKIPENPPQIGQYLLDNSDEFSRLWSRPDIQEFIRKMVRRYAYWSKFKYLPMPDGVKPEMAWVLREYAAMGQMRSFPLRDTRGQPFRLWLTEKANEYLHLIDRKSPLQIVSIAGSLTPQARDRYVVSSLMEEAIASSQIEGAATTRQAAKEMLRTKRAPADKSQRMIFNNYRAIGRIRELKQNEMSVAVLLELHTLLTEGTLEDSDVGRIRQSPNDDDIQIRDFDGTILHEPPKASELEGRLESFIQFANDADSKEFIHPVIKAILLHFWIGYDHPFVDGNGRTARAVFYWYMLRKGYDIFEYTSISRIVLKAYGEYKRAFLHSEISNNDATYFIHYNLRAINAAIDEVHRHIARKKRELQESAALVKTLPGVNSRQRELLFDALHKPGKFYSIYEHQNTHQISYQTARMDMLDLESLGYLSSVKDGRTSLFFPTEKLKQVVVEPAPKTDY